MVTINESYHPGGVPAVGDGVDINFHNISIRLNRSDYESMVSAISDKVGKDLKTLTEKYDKYYGRVHAVNSLTKAFIETFYEQYDDIAIKKSVGNVDFTSFDKILEEHSKLLGFE